MRQNPGLTIAQAGDMAASDVGHQTIVKNLKKFGISLIVSAKLPTLSANHIAKRMDFWSFYRNNSLIDWKAWTFSDECSAELDYSEGIQRFLIKKINDLSLNLRLVDVKEVVGN